MHRHLMLFWLCLWATAADLPTWPFEVQATHPATDGTVIIRGYDPSSDLTMLLVSHDLSMVTRLAGQVICLNRVVLSEGKAAEVLNEKTLSGCFGADKGLLLHDHPWGEDAEINCAYHPDQDHGDH